MIGSYYQQNLVKNVYTRYNNKNSILERIAKHKNSSLEKIFLNKRLSNLVTYRNQITWNAEIRIKFKAFSTIIQTTILIAYSEKIAILL